MRKIISVIRLPRRLLWLLPALLAATLLINVDLGLADVKALLLGSAGLPALEQAQALTAPCAEETVGAVPEQAREEPQEETLLIIAGSRPGQEGDESGEALPVQAVIYCTHTSEEYLGQTRQKGVAGGVLSVAMVLAASLEAQGIGVILDETVHDGDYNASYAHSLDTLTGIAAEYPDVRLYIDVHRDSAVDGVSTSLTQDGVSFARMLLIVGSDEQLPHPNWELNYAFAQAVSAAANQRLPGIMQEPRVYGGRYNQHMGDRAILVEIGSTDNYQEEAERSAWILAEAIASCL